MSLRTVCSHIFLTSLPWSYLFSEKVSARYGDLKGELRLVELNKCGNGLGLSLAGNKDRTKMSVFVVGVHPDSPAAPNVIQVGDELLEVSP